ncbi:hypothetical protein ANCDUO_12716 [Ancylostoma duodenale]|uniref:Uncharacterized protein n=1 Tax=Ancylostoma duodenale TaxID=51022 RepID=A0A0C2G7X6_9BILA|nr:hypothetical protein ANCDUO_12716 [Ancylostoma duodenale]
MDFERVLRAHLIHELSSDGTRDYKQCLKQWRSATKYDVSTVCARAVLGFQRLWPGKLVRQRLHGPRLAGGKP